MIHAPHLPTELNSTYYSCCAQTHLYSISATCIMATRYRTAASVAEERILELTGHFFKAPGETMTAQDGNPTGMVRKTTGRSPPAASNRHQPSDIEKTGIRDGTRSTGKRDT